MRKPTDFVKDVTTTATFRQARTRKPGFDAERRNQQRFQRLNQDNPCCLNCGESNPCCLQAHHIAGKTYDDTLAELCANCHAKLSDTQRDHPAQITDPPNVIERAAHFLLGLGDLLLMLGAKCRDFGLALLEWAQGQLQGAPGNAVPAEGT